MLTKKQLKRIALAAEAHYILTGAETHAVTNSLSEEETAIFHKERQALALRWLKEAGFTERPGSIEEIFLKVMGWG